MYTLKHTYNRTKNKLVIVNVIILTNMSLNTKPSIKQTKTQISKNYGV